MWRLILVLLVLSPSASIWAAEEEVKPEIFYVRLYPDFITNLSSKYKATFLQVRIELMTHGEEKKKLIEHNEPLLRDKLILLFNAQSIFAVKGKQARQELQKKALALVQEHLKNETGQPLVEQIYFTKVIVE